MRVVRIGRGTIYVAVQSIIMFLVGLPAIILISALAYARLHIVSKNDLLQLFEALISKE